MAKRRQWKLVSMLILCLALAGCSSGDGARQADEYGEVAAKVKRVRQVSVLTTDGQEIPLNVNPFREEFDDEGKRLELSAVPLELEDVRYTLIAYFPQEAPLVIEVGQHAIRIGDKTYRGDRADAFYHWSYTMIGKTLFKQGHSGSVFIMAEDQGSTRWLKETDAAYVWKLLEAAEFLQPQQLPAYPLYPGYRLKLETGQQTLDAAMMAPGTLSVNLGKEVFVYRVPHELFSYLTELLPPGLSEEHPLDKLFRAENVTLSGDGETEETLLSHSDPIVRKGMAHQLVRLLKQGKKLSAPPAAGKQALSVLRFELDGYEETVYVYERHFLVEDTWYEAEGINERIRRLVQVQP